MIINLLCVANMYATGSMSKEIEHFYTLLSLIGQW